MNCQEFESIVNDLARQQIMETDVREQALAHSGACGTCALRLQDERLLTEGLRALAKEMESAEAPVRVERQLLTAFRSQKIPLSQPLATVGWRRYWVGAAATVVILVGGIVAMRGRVGPSVQSLSEQVANSQVANQVKEPETQRVVKDKPLSVFSRKDQAPRLSASRRRHPANRYDFASLASKPVLANPVKGEDPRAEKRAGAVTANSVSTEIATDFLPVGYGSALSLQDGGQLVRVELPRSALVRFGLPVNVNRTNERVKADVLVGVDGLARAIRFVQ